MNLTTYERMRRHCASFGSDNLSDSVNNKRDLVNYIGAASTLVQNFLGYELELKSYTEYFDSDANKTEYFTNQKFITALTSVYQDSSSLWSGAQSEITDCFIGTDDRSIVLPYAVGYSKKKSLRAIYTAGLATSACSTSFAFASLDQIAVLLTAGMFLLGSTSLAAAKIIAVTNESQPNTCEILWGKFQLEETVTAYSDINFSVLVGTYMVTDQAGIPLCQNYPDIVKACEMQTRFYWAKSSTFEDSQMSKDGTSTKNYDAYNHESLRPEVTALLMPYKRVFVV